MSQISIIRQRLGTKLLAKLGEEGEVRQPPEDRAASGAPRRLSVALP